MAVVENLRWIKEQLDAAGLSRIALWGAGKFGQKWFETCRQMLPPIQVILDDAAQTKSLDNVPIRKPTMEMDGASIDALVVTCDLDWIFTLHRRIKSLPMLSSKPVFYLALNQDQNRLMELRDRHQGETIFLLGNGPSVRTEDLERLERRPVFCCNKFFKAYGKTRLRPPYVVSADQQTIEDFGEEIIRCSTGQVFYAMETRPALTGDFIWIPAHNHGQPLLDDSLLYQAASICSASLIIALQIGYWMGGRKFAIYGMDHSFQFTTLTGAEDRLRSVVGEGNHFIENYRDGRPWCPPRLDLIEAGFAAAKRQLHEQGGWIKNATRGGNFDVVERIDFEDSLGM